MLITFEGIDGSGKSTQISLLKDKLTSLGYTVKVFREPGGTLLSEEIRELLLNTDLEIDSVTELLLFSSARSQLMAEEVLPALKREEIVILDRFYDSTTAYQGYGRKSLPLDQIQQINNIASHGRTPDLTFYLRLSLDASNQRRAHLNKDRMERAGDQFFENVIRGFDELAKKEERFIVVEASKTIEEIHEKIVDTVYSKMK